GIAATPTSSGRACPTMLSRVLRATKELFGSAGVLDVFIQSLDETIPREQSGPLDSLAAHPADLLRVVGEIRHLLRKRLRGRVEQSPGLPVRNALGRATAVHGEHRLAEGHGLHGCEPPWLARRQE